MSLEPLKTGLMRVLWYASFRPRIRHLMIMDSPKARRDYLPDWYKDCGCGPADLCANGPEGRDWQRFVS